MTSSDGGLRRDALAGFLRSCRARLRPVDVGLPDTRRRTPGLRRQEVAQLAGISVDYYIRLEQGRGPRPSRQVLSALARALLLTRDEREYLFRVGGKHPPAATGPHREVTPGVRHLLNSLRETPAYVVDAKYDLLAWNALAAHFLGDPGRVPESDRNLIWWMFRQPETDPHWRDPEALRFVRATVADLRAAYARYPGDPGIEALVSELLRSSSRFAEMWAAHEVEVRRRIVKQVVHPVAGPLELDCQVMYVPDTDQRLIVYCAEPGSPTWEALRRLAATPAAAADRTTADGATADGATADRAAADSATVSG